jgi:hypothetical protein
MDSNSELALGPNTSDIHKVSFCQVNIESKNVGLNSLLLLLLLFRSRLCHYSVGGGWGHPGFYEWF